MYAMKVLFLILLLLASVTVPVELQEFVPESQETFSELNSQTSLKLNHRPGKLTQGLLKMRGATTLFVERTLSLTQLFSLTAAAAPDDFDPDPTRFSICLHFSIPPPALLA